VTRTRLADLWRDFAGKRDGLVAVDFPLTY
jgi:hypothetical protein